MKVKFVADDGTEFVTKEEAEFTIEKLKVIAELKRFMEENNEPIDWNDLSKEKYFLYYAFDTKCIVIDYGTGWNLSDIFFSSYEFAKKAIETIGEERLKKYYFEVES